MTKNTIDPKIKSIVKRIVECKIVPGKNIIDIKECSSFFIIYFEHYIGGKLHPTSCSVSKNEIIKILDEEINSFVFPG